MDTIRPFTDAAAVARYAEETPRKVPGYADLHRMTMLMLAERAPDAADILVYGAGGGLELRAFAEAQPGWRLTGVDPSAEMLALASHVVGSHADRVALVKGYIADAPPGPFDGATCLLTLHFLRREERLDVLRAVRQRMKPGARLVVAHHSYPAGDDLKDWLLRSAFFADREALEPARVRASVDMMAEKLPILSSDEEERLLFEAGFGDISLFYAAFSFRGWCATA